MNFDNTTPHNPAHEHRPSYYIYHRARAYGAQAPNASYPPVSKRYEPFEFFRDPKPASIDRGPQTVEDLVRDGYFAVSKREPETAVIVDRQDMAWLSLDDALTQIREREDIYRKNLLEIEWAKCYAFGELARLGCRHPIRRPHSINGESPTCTPISVPNVFVSGTISHECDSSCHLPRSCT